MMLKYIFGGSVSFIQKCKVVLIPMKIGQRKVQLMSAGDSLYMVGTIVVKVIRKKLRKKIR